MPGRHGGWPRPKGARNTGRGRASTIVWPLRTVERAVAPFRRLLTAEAKATVRFETPPHTQRARPPELGNRADAVSTAPTASLLLLVLKYPDETTRRTGTRPVSRFLHFYVSGDSRPQKGMLLCLQPVCALVAPRPWKHVPADQAHADERASAVESPGNCPMSPED